MSIFWKNMKQSTSTALIGLILVFLVYCQQYFEAHFALEKDSRKIKLNWLGFEVISGKIIAYQESIQQSYLAQLVVKNAILIDTYPKQVNTVNFQGKDLQGAALFGSLMFDYRSQEATIRLKNTH